MTKFTVWLKLDMRMYQEMEVVTFLYDSFSYMRAEMRNQRGKTQHSKEKRS